MPHPHGTTNRYNNQRCRCDLCRVAIRNYRREQRAEAKPVPAPYGRFTIQKNRSRPCASEQVSIGCSVIVVGLPGVGAGGWAAVSGQDLWMEF